MKALVQYQCRSFAVLLFFVGLQATAYGQLKANFTATPLSGCSPLLVYFSESSTGNPTQWKWDLGNGVTSFLRNPSATYFNPGTYTVKLVVSNATGKDSVIKTEYITVYDNPTVAFDFDKSTGCFPLPVHFSDQSTAGHGEIAAWQWDFGDGTIASGKNPVHTYTSAGQFNLTLRVTNSAGCVKSLAREGAITIASGVKAGFTNTDPGLCPAPATVQFTNASQGPGPLQYQWQFGDGSGSTDASPSHLYSQNGNYSVRLIATSPQGCVDTAIKNEVFQIGTARADFSYPAAACVNTPLPFTNTTAPQPTSVQWNFGDGSTSTLLHPEKTFIRAGSYTVTLISFFGACSDTVKKTLTIAEKPVAGFTSSLQSACRLPVPVRFTPTDIHSGYSYFWDFGDGVTDTASHPTHAYTREGTFTVKLVITNAAGCTDALVKTAAVTVQVPKITISGLPKNGCVPVDVKPVATLSAGYSLASSLWNFGDGSTATEALPLHTYTAAGTFDVTLIATTTTGCTDTVVMRSAVRTGNKPQAGFSSQPVNVCPYEKVFFTDTSTGNTDQWLWEFGDGSSSGEQNPVHQYSETGWQDVTLVVYSNTCPDTLLVKKAVHVNPPLARFELRQSCEKKFTKSFVDQSLGAEGWFWEFGDGTTSSEKNPEHVYRSTGTYKVKLTVMNGSCSNVAVKTVLVIDEEAAFAMPDSILCRNSTAGFSTTGINAGNIANWTWDYGDGTGSLEAGATQHRYTKSGTYTVSLTLTDLLNCKSTQSKTLTVFGPTAAFRPSVAATCLQNNRVTFVDASTPDSRHPLQSWIWNYGDGTLDSSSAAPYQHSYTTAGTYTVGLTVVDAFGCRDSLQQAAAVIIARPVADFTVSDTLSCTGKAVAFANTSNAVSPVYQWSFGDGHTSVLTSPTHAYAATGLYAIQLKVTDQYGCQDSIVKTDYLQISFPKAAFSLSDSVGTCPPMLVHFSNASKDYTNIAWNFGDGNHSLLDTPAHFYATPGTFQAILVATGPGGCTDTARRTIVVKGPTGTLQYEPLTACNPLTVNFTATTRNKASFIWDFSDGITTASRETGISHTYVAAGDFVPKLILTDEAGCSVPIIGTDTIRVKGIATSFSLSGAQFCNDGLVQFTNHTVSNDYITGYQWDFGDGATSREANPEHHYTKTGTYSVQLSVSTLSGCSDLQRLPDTVTVHANPSVQINGDDEACAPAKVAFTAAVQRGNPALLQWNWNLANGQTSTLQNPASQTYAADGTYTVETIVTDEHGCRDTAHKTLRVHPLPTTSAGPDQWICRGSVQQLKATGAENYQWQAAPSLSCADCDSPLAAPTDSTLYVVTGTNAFGCSKTDSVVIRVHQPFTLSVAKGDTICAGQPVRLAATGADQYTWTPSLDIKDPAAGITTASPKTSTLYHLEAKDNANCFTDTASVYIKVWPMPRIAMESIQTLSIGNALKLSPTYSDDISAYQWSNAQTLSCATCPSPVANPKTETTYAVNVQNNGGCSGRAEVTVRVICNGGNLFIPNTFSPNTDGRNDRFYPRGTGISSIKSLKVFNRWGQLVFNRENFNANDAAAGWDGSFKGQLLSPDVYIYTCEVICQNNEVLSYKGDVTLLR